MDICAARFEPKMKDWISRIVQEIERLASSNMYTLTANRLE